MNERKWKNWKYIKSYDEDILTKCNNALILGYRYSSYKIPRIKIGRSYHLSNYYCFRIPRVIMSLMSTYRAVAQTRKNCTKKHEWTNDDWSRSMVCYLYRVYCCVCTANCTNTMAWPRIKFSINVFMVTFFSCRQIQIHRIRMSHRLWTKACPVFLSCI